MAGNQGICLCSSGAVRRPVTVFGSTCAPNISSATTSPEGVPDRLPCSPTRSVCGVGGLDPSRAAAHRGSLAVSAGAKVKAVQRMLGHASATMTHDVYSGLFDDDLDGVAEQLDPGARVYSMCTEASVVPLTAESAGR